MGPIVVIGAGLCGLTAARRLAGAGRDVVVFDKSRGTGGRLATRRSDAGTFDHGAPAAHGDVDFDVAMSGMSGLGTCRSGPGWVARPGMSALVKPLADGLDVRSGTRVTGLQRDGGRWRVLAGDDDLGGFETVILAIPAPQAAELAPHADLETVGMSPVWTLMAVYEGDVTTDPTPPPFGSLHPQGDGGIVAHAGAGWSRDHLEYDKPLVAGILSDALGEVTGRVATHAQTHRWRYARTAAPLGRPVLDYGDGRLAGGDWTLGPNAGDAWQSGLALADAALF